MDFLALILEELMERIVNAFDSINNIAVKTTLQIFAMILCCALCVGIVFLIGNVSLQVINYFGFTSKVLKAIVGGITFVFAFVLMCAVIWFITVLVKR